MADHITASIHPIHQAAKPAAKTPAERARAYRERVRAAKAQPAPVARIVPAATTKPAPVAIPGTPAHRRAPRPPLASILLMAVGIGLACVGVTINGWFAHGLGSTTAAGWLFLAIGVAADLAALILPACAAKQWQARARGTALAGWAVFAVTFVFAVTASIGFASQNISDVTTARASRSTPAIDTARAALADAMAARDRECRGGVGRNCRQREDVVTHYRGQLDQAMRAIEQTADPQSQAAIRVVSWMTFGLVRPGEDDFAMLRLILLALLPQVGGILLMVSRRA